MTRTVGAEHVGRLYRKLEARDWPAVEELLAPDVVYDLPQSRRRVTGRGGFLRFNQEYPGEWHLEVLRVHADATGAAVHTKVTIGSETATGLEFLTFDAAGLLTRIDSFWPEPYEAPTEPGGVLVPY